MTKIALFFIFILSLPTLAQDLPTDVVTQKFEADTFVKKDGSAKTTFKIVKKIETDAGRTEVALTKVNFLKSSNTFKLIEAYSVQGKIKSEVKKNKLVIRNADVARHGISDLMEAIIPFENLSVGSEIFLTYELSSKPKAGKYFSEMLVVDNSTLAKVERYSYVAEVRLKADQIEYNPYFDMFPIYDTNKNYGFEVRPSQIAYQAAGIDIQSSTFVFTTVPSWEELRKSEVLNFEPELQKALPPKYEKIYASVKSLSDPKVVIEKVAEELAKTITYAGDWQTEKGKFVPQAMASAAAKGRGDCKDYTTAMVAILRKLGFTAYPFLTFRSASYAGKSKLLELAKIPNPDYFNHVIVHAKDKSGKAWWVDPTNPYVQADIITADILGNFGLLLDDSSTDVSFLPDKNSDPANLSLMRSLVIEADNSINGKAILAMNASSHNTFGMVERMYGKEGLAKTFGMLLNPSLKSTKVDIKQANIKDHKYEFDFVANDWVVDQKKLKLLVLINPFAFLADRLTLKKDIDIGEPGLTKIVTRVKKQKVEDTVAAGCLVRSTWFHFDRIVENTPDALIVTDELNVKKRFISKQESQGRQFEALLGDIGSCLRNGSALVIHMDSSLKSADDIANEKKNGPLLENLTDKQADDYYSRPSYEKTSFLRTKLIRFYQNKLKTQQTASIYRKLGMLTINLGFLSGREYGAGYMAEGLDYYAKSLQLATGTERDEILAEVIDHKLSANKITEAVVHFNEYYKSNSKKFKAFELAAQIAVEKNNVKDAEMWIKGGEKFAITKEEKQGFYRTIQDVLMVQKRYAEAIPYQEKALELDQSGWGYHNLAVLYFETKNFDKVIELENKALKLMEFGMAKHMLSLAYTQKFIMNSQAGTRSPANDEEALDFLQKALKYDSTNVNALVSMAMFQAIEYTKKKDKITLTKGKSYLEQAVSIEPDFFKVREGMRIYKDLEAGKEVPHGLIRAIMGFGT